MSGYRPMTVAELADELRPLTDDRDRWRMVAEFLEEYRHEPDDVRIALLVDEPRSTGDGHWDVFLAALAEHVAARDGRGAPEWTDQRILETFWFPFNSRGARADALVHSPPSFRRRGIFVAPQELEVA